MKRYLLIGRNQDNNKFTVDRIYNNIFIQFLDLILHIFIKYNIKTEKELCDDINSNFAEYFTYNYIDNKYINIYVKNDHVISQANNSKIDNILNLPIIIK